MSLITVRDDFRLSLNPRDFAAAVGLSADPWQQKALVSTARRIIFLCARQAGKSTIAAIIALHRAMFFPESLILLLSPSQRQSSELFRKFMFYFRRTEQPLELLEENRLSLTLSNHSRVVSLPATEATILGFSGPDLIIEDEAARVPDDLFFAVMPMLAVSGGRIILMSTPFGQRGHFYSAWDSQEWERYQVTAYEVPRIPAKFLEEQKKIMPWWRFRQEFLCEFISSTETPFDPEHVMAALSSEVLPLFGSVGETFIASESHS